MGKNQIDREFIQAVRRVNGLTIFFKNKEAIYVEDEKSGRKYVYHRWFESTPGFYMNNWRKFSWSLKYLDNLDIDDIQILSVRYGAKSTWALKMPDIPKDIKVIPTKRKRGNEN